MKSIGKALGKEIARILVILAVIAAVVFYLKGNNWFKKIFEGDTEAKYEHVVERFSKKNELLVADAAVIRLRRRYLIQMRLKTGQTGQRQLLM